MEVWKMIRTGNEKLDPNTLVLPVAAGAAITEATMVALGTDGYAVAGLEGGQPHGGRGGPGAGG